jgi:putative ABC transport system permease protein
MTLAIVALGVVVALRILDFPDLTVDGTFMLGAAVCAALIVRGVPPGPATLAAVPVGALAGTVTGLLHTRLKVSKLLSGILMMTMLYSVGLRVMGRSNIPLLNETTILTPLERGAHSHGLTTCFFAVIVGALAVLIWKGLQTQFGLALRATGDNPDMATSVGINTDHTKVVGLAFANAVVALGGALVAQHQGFADVTMGIGTIMVGLAAIIIGEAFVQPRTLLRLVLAVVVGSVAYELVVGLGLRLGLAPSDLRLATGIIIILALILGGSGDRKSNSAVPQRY